jgi:hypothetical protein
MFCGWPLGLLVAPGDTSDRCQDYDHAHGVPPSLCLKPRPHDLVAQVSDNLPTPRSTLASRLRVHVRCPACRHRDYADLQALIDSGRGDVPLIQLRYRCSNCSGGSQFTDWVVTNG